MDEAAARAAAKTSTLIVPRRQRGRRRKRTDDVEEEQKQDQQQSDMKAERHRQEEQKMKEANEKKQEELKQRAIEADRRAADLLIQLNVLKTKVFNAFETENRRFNEQVQKANARLNKAAQFADRDQFMKEVTRMNRLDRETEMLLSELEKVSQRKPKTKTKTKEETEGKEGKESRASTPSKGKSKGAKKDKDNKGAAKPSTPSKKSVRLDTKIKKILKEMPPQLGLQCRKLCQKQRQTAYALSGKNVRDVISACGEQVFIEDILDRKFKLYKKALLETRKARGEQNSAVSISKDELAGLAGGYPLCAAARQGQHNICKTLLEILKGDAVNILDSTGLAPILLAARGGYDLMAKHLLDNGAFADAVDSGRCNALMLAARQEDRFYDAERQRRTDLQKLFAKYNKGGGGKNTNKDGDNDNYESTNLGFRPLQKNHNRVLKLLLAVGANFNHRDSWGRSVLTHAAEGGNHAGVRMLLRAGARVNSADNKKQWTSIHYAVFHNHFFTAHNLIKGGANVDAADDNGITPLILAANAPNQLEMVKLLLFADANTGLTSTYGQSCASCARDRNDDVVLDIIREGVPDKYDPNKVVIRIRTSRGMVKRRRKRKSKKKKNAGDGKIQEKISNALLNPSEINDDKPMSTNEALHNATKFDDDDSGVEDIKSDEDYGDDEEEEGKEGKRGGEEKEE